jgi:hypothetical protein
VFIGGSCGAYEGTRVRARAVLGGGGGPQRAPWPSSTWCTSACCARARGGPGDPRGGGVVPGARPRQAPSRGAQGVLVQTPSIVMFRDAGTEAAGGARGGAAVSLRPAAGWRGIERTLIRRIFDAAPAGRHPARAGQPDLVSPPSICLAGVQAIAEGRTGVHVTAGDPELRAAVAARYAPWIAGADGDRHHDRLAGGDVRRLPHPARSRRRGALPRPRLSRLPGGGAPDRRAGRLLSASAAERAFRLSPRTALPDHGADSAWAIVCSPGNPTGAVHGREDLHALCGGSPAPGWPGSPTRSTPATATAMPAPPRSRSRPRAGS